ncbi:MAG: hypothetical protein K2K15_02125, partial [Anaeroplasmataceae bacterium]|nr:hypothetical protein [Anaeroplasmataceae bacterium]
LYMMLAAVETFIDKDEDGNIPNEFDFDNLQNELKLRQNEIDTICASAILNASLSEKIVNIFDVPLDKYIGQNIEKVELNAFFEALFKMFDKTEIIVKELDENLFDLNFERNAIPVILDSVIMRSTISEKITNLHDLAIPETDVQGISFVNKPDGYLIHKTELETVFEAMFVMLQTDKIMVNDLNVEVTSFSITKEAISLMTSSSILRATVSEKLASNPDLVILKNDTLEQTILHRSNSVHTIEEAELDKLLNSMFTILNVQEFTVNDVTNEFSDLSIKKKDIPVLIDSNILNATLSRKVTNVEDLVIPMSIVDPAETVLGTMEYVLTSLEASHLLESIFVIAGTEELAVNDFSSLMNTFDLNSEKIDTLLESIILQATLSKNFMEGTNLVIPSVVLETIPVLHGENTSQIIKEELEIFFDAIFATTDNSISGTAFDLEQMNLPTTYETASAMTNSLIISATLSSNVMTEDSIVKIVDEVLTPYEFNQAFTVEPYIKQEELTYLLLALTNGMGKTNPTQLSFDDIAIPTETAARQALVDSLIIRTTISEKVLNQPTVKLSLNNLSLDTTKHLNQASVGILSAEEINRIIVGLELLSPGNSSFDNLTLDIGQIINLENSGEVLEAIAQSEVYRSIISDTLGQNATLAGTSTRVYQLFCSNMASHQVKVEGTDEMYFYDLDTIEVFGVPNSGYVIKYPTTTERVYINFYLEEAEAVICSKADIKALEFTSTRSL